MGSLTDADSPPQITLYTNYMCPYAHRAHITLKELGLSYEEVLIDLDVPREQWYLEVNPRGLVPSMKFTNGAINNEIITESAILTQFLCDLKPSHLLPASLASPTAPLIRARINFFVDTYNTKIGPFTYKVLLTDSEAEKQARAKEWVAAVGKEIEPLLHDANPFFGGSKEFTFAEVQAAPFVIRTYALSKHGILPTSIKEGLDKLPRFSAWANAMLQKESVTFIWDEQKFVQRTRARIAKMKGQAK